MVDLFVNKGDFVQSGQLLAQMQSDVLNAQRDEARAQQQQAINTVASAEAQVAVRESDLAAAHAVVVQRNARLYPGCHAGGADHSLCFTRPGDSLPGGRFCCGLVAIPLPHRHWFAVFRCLPEPFSPKYQSNGLTTPFND